MRLIQLAGIAFALLLSGCSTHFVKPGASSTDFEQDKRECEYEALKYGYVQSTYHGGGGYGSAIGAGIGEGIAQAMRNREIMMKCLQIKGWSVARKENQISDNIND